jgi:twitching motility protein PilT
MLTPLLNEILRSSAENKASDVILRVETTPLFRINGELFPVECANPMVEDMDALWKACRAQPTDLDHDASLSTESGERFRVNLHRQLGQRGAVLRRIRRDIPNLEILGAPADLLLQWAKSKSASSSSLAPRALENQPPWRPSWIRSTAAHPATS